jgi:lantibiotic modifying enzyme
LILQDILDNSSLLDLASRFGDELLRKADKQENQCSWSSASFPKHRALTGFSHGAAGIGYALLELSRATRDLKYLGFAESAFNYERSWFNEEMSNWPDLRGVSAKAKPNYNPFSFPVSWCHGAAGIALSRLRAYRILKDEKYRSEALTALRTTLKWTRTMLDSGTANFSLCHGLAGNAEILFYGYQVLQHEFNGGFELAQEVAVAGINRYAERNQRWPFGKIGHKSPSLMLGLSGVGYFYLRLYNPATPSFLILENEKYCKVELV